MPLPNVPYYAWQIHASFENNIKLPPDLKKHTNPYGQLKLLGKDVAPRTVEPLLTLVLQKKVRLLYISPFAPAGEDESLQRELNNQLLCETYTHGCGVMGFNREKSIACLRRLDASSLNLRRTKAAGDAPLPCPPVVFDSYQTEAGASRPRPPIPGGVSIQGFCTGLKTSCAPFPKRRRTWQRSQGWLPTTTSPPTRCFPIGWPPNRGTGPFWGSCQT